MSGKEYLENAQKLNEQRGASLASSPCSALWEHRKEEGEVPCHTRVIGGILCRWWGDNPPSGVAMLDEAFPSQNDQS